MASDAGGLSRRKQLQVVWRALQFRPRMVAATIFLSLFAAVFEGIGLGFLIPMVSLAQDSEAGAGSGRHLDIFVQAYEFLGIPFTLEFVIIGTAVILTIRYTTSFVVAWLRAILGEDYKRHLQKRTFDGAINAEVGYFDEQGSDDILNTIVTESGYAGGIIVRTIKLINQSFLLIMYLAIAIFISPLLSLLTIVLLIVITYGLRWVIESGSDIGDRVAEANRRIQESAQAGIQGIRDVKLFGMADEVQGELDQSVDQKARSTIKLQRNKAAMNNFYNLSTAVTLFVLVYLALAFANLSLAELSIFLFTVFRLAPRASAMNDTFYNLEGKLPHLYRTQQFLADLERRQEPETGSRALPEKLNKIDFDEVWFSYDNDEQVLEGLSFTLSNEEFIAFVGQSGAGKSTIASLLARMYDPDQGEIRANGTPIQTFDLAAWRDRISVVRQNPYIFDDTLRRNITIANRDSSQSEIERVCDIAQVTEFLDELPAGYDTRLGENGVRLSGGQKQRVALARALLKEGDVLVLDEATSDLDANIEEDVHRAIEAMDRDYATLVIAHRLSTVLNADRIYAVMDGQILESGTHRELMENEEAYAELYETQAKSV